MLRDEVAKWRDAGYSGATDTTLCLLNFWFKTDHRTRERRPFRYHYSQQYAIETLIYLFEVVKVRRQKSLIEKYADRKELKLLQYDEFARYCVKMATGSGKTKVMCLAIAWQFFNAVAESGEIQADYAKTFLVIAPNIIVFERLRSDFEGGRIFINDPVIPDDLRLFWDFQCYMRGDGERAGSEGALYLTNIQQLFERPDKQNDEPDVMTAMLGPKPPTNALETTDFLDRIKSRCGPVIVVNDEAHHTHDEESEWNKTIRRLHETLTVGEKPGLAAQLDFTATPRHIMGQLFSWTVYDYPLKQAILDRIVKKPLKGITSGIKEQSSNIASTRYQAYLTAGVERWREYRDQLKPLFRKPILFVMMNDTSEADDVGDWLRTKYPEEFAGDKLLVIHTDRSGDVSKKDLDAARGVARDADKNLSPVNCIVSVVMLREGWDVQGVTVIVGLRPYTAKANILPEQTLGRGLRLMFRDQTVGYDERVDVIGNKKFIEFVADLEREEDLQLDTFEVGKDKVSIVTIEPVPEKMDKDIALPELSPMLIRKKSMSAEIAALDVMAFSSPVFPMKDKELKDADFKYEGFDFITKKKEVERDYKLPAMQTAEEVIGFYARKIAQDVKLPSQFADLVPKVRNFLEHKAFGKTVELNGPGMVKAISNTWASFITVSLFAKELRKVVVQEMKPVLLDAGRLLSTTPKFPWSRQRVSSPKTIFNFAACGNSLEKEFAEFLHNADDVERFAKLPERFEFAIEYTDSATNLRYYEPDFVAVTVDKTYYLLETKGQENIDVAHKDQAARLWCENAELLTGNRWRYLKIPQKQFTEMQPALLADLLCLATI